MSIFNNVKSCELSNSHGEVNFLRVTEGTVETSALENISPDTCGFIVGHSESGHHHVLEREGVTMFKGTEKGMDILYALIEKPVTLKQSAGAPHKQQTVEPGKYIITNNVDYDPFSQQAKRVAD